MPATISSTMPFVLSLPELMSTLLKAQITSNPKAIVNTSSGADVDDHDRRGDSLPTST